MRIKENIPCAIKRLAQGKEHEKNSNFFKNHKCPSPGGWPKCGVFTRCDTTQQSEEKLLTLATTWLGPEYPARAKVVSHSGVLPAGFTPQNPEADKMPLDKEVTAVVPFLTQKPKVLTGKGPDGTSGASQCSRSSPGGDAQVDPWPRMLETCVSYCTQLHCNKSYSKNCHQSDRKRFVPLPTRGSCRPWQQAHPSGFGQTRALSPPTQPWLPWGPLPERQAALRTHPSTTAPRPGFREDARTGSLL